ncbi:MAG TPA: hypothetical protein VND97_00545 [Beijerinckiaceae bacterium]|nr:hypothetical protein [Beijerinckiaceae bacterium]
MRSASWPNIFLVLAFSAAWAPARASDFSPVPLPTFAQAPSSAGEAPDPWRGLYAGSDLSFTSGKYGGIGGGAYIGYNREFDNHWVIGVEGGVGYSPNLFSYPTAAGYNYGVVSVKTGYDMGRFMPFVTAGMILAKPNDPLAHYTGPMDSANDLFNQSGKLSTLTSVGAGFDYAVTNNVSVEMSVSATQGGVAWPTP